MESGYVFSATSPNITFAVVFNETMDTTVLPPASRLTCIVDGVDKGCSAVSWHDSTTLLVSTVAEYPVIQARVYLLIEHPNLRSAGLVVAQAVQGVIAWP